MIYTPTTKEFRIGREGENVILSIDGKRVEVPWQAARQIGDAIKAQSLKAEEWTKAEQVAADQAVLLRLGIGVGLTDSPHIQNEAKKQAAWGSDLRRYIPLTRANGVNGIKSGEVFGTPLIRRMD